MSSKSHKFKTICLSFIFALTLALASFTIISQPSVSAANPLCSQSGVSEEVLRANGCKTDSPDLENVVVNIINGVVGALALVAVIFIVVGGVNYMTSTGDAGKIQKAKNTILYAAIGLVICVLAFAIVNFVIANILNSSSSDGEEGRLPSYSSIS